MHPKDPAAFWIAVPSNHPLQTWLYQISSVRFGLLLEQILHCCRTRMTSLLPVNKSAWLHPFLLLPSAHRLLPVLSFSLRHPMPVLLHRLLSVRILPDAPALSPHFLLPLHPCSPDRHLPVSAHHFEQLLHHIFSGLWNAPFRHLFFSLVHL